MLSKLTKGQEVLLLKTNTSGGCEIGDIAKVNSCTDLSSIHLHIKARDDTLQILQRHQLLAISDKVERGPDWDTKHEHLGGYGNQDGGVGKQGVVTHLRSSRTQPIRVRWDADQVGANPYYRMTPDHQDLKPTGDSVEDGKPEEKGKSCVGQRFIMTETFTPSVSKQDFREGDAVVLSRIEKDGVHRYRNERTGEDHFLYSRRIKPLMTEEELYKPIKEDSIMATQENRSARERELELEVIPARKCTVADAELALDQDEKELARLKKHKTDHAETIDDIKTVHGLEDEQAEAALRLSKKGIVITS